MEYLKKEEFYNITLFFQNGRIKKYIHCRPQTCGRIIEKYKDDEDLDFYLEELFINNVDDEFIDKDV